MKDVISNLANTRLKEEKIMIIRKKFILENLDAITSLCLKLKIVWVVHPVPVSNNLL